MILTLAEAQAIKPGITQAELDAFETSIRTLTNNNFQVFHTRLRSLTFSGKIITASKGITTGMRVGDTVEVNDSRYNDGLYVIASLTENTITITGDDFFSEETSASIVTLVRYPADIKSGVIKLIGYDVKMADKVGIKSETISRMSVTYYDVNSSENAEGYPKALMSFIKKYEKMRW